jgi:predicted membrane channel-forming protein YqfA (hemolysin III family)
MNMEALYTSLIGKRGLRGHLRFYKHIGISFMIIIAASLVTIMYTVAQSMGFHGQAVSIVESVAHWGWIIGASLFMYALIAGSITAFLRVEVEEKQEQDDKEKS